MYPKRQGPIVTIKSSPRNTVQVKHTAIEAGSQHEHAARAGTMGPVLAFMPYCHHLEILKNFEQEFSHFYFTLGPAVYVAGPMCKSSLGIFFFLRRKKSLLINKLQ